MIVEVDRQRFALAARRIAAAVIDDLVVATPLAIAALVQWRRGPIPAAVPSPTVAPARARVAVALFVTVPAGVAMGVADSLGGSPGKRLMRIRVEADDSGSPLTRGAGALRGLLTVTAPWELGHQAVWSLVAGRDRPGAAFAAGAYGLLIAQAAGAVGRTGRTYADRLVGSVVRARPPSQGQRPCRRVVSRVVVSRTAVTIPETSADPRRTS